MAQTTTIDDYVADGHVPKIDFIKMDIEGSEVNALRGAVKTIRRFRPKLAISVYHKIDDLITIPLLIKDIEPSYNLVLDHYTVHQEETVLYGTPTLERYRD
jgi:hypothetical protein